MFVYRSSRNFLPLLLTIMALGLPAAAQTITDGDTIAHNGRVYRLWGIDAPESKQTCAEAGPQGACRRLGSKR